MNYQLESKEQLIRRLTQLKSEYEAGQAMLNELEQKELNLRATLLRIRDAIKTLEDLLSI